MTHATENVRGNVDVWIGRTGGISEGDAAALAAACDEQERARARRLARPEERRRWLVTRGAVRALLAGYLGIEAQEVALRRDPSGKPRLDGDAGDLRFNVSHAGDAVAVAVATGREVGVDIAVRDAAVEVDVILRHLFPAEEAARLLALVPSARRAAFFRSWSRREALVKADGGALRLQSMHELRVPAADLPSPAPRRVPGAVGWAVADVAAPDGYVAAVAAAGADWRPVPRHWKAWIGPQAVSGAAGGSL
jgi:4'-phosphopantetheinyl transferase